MTRPMEFDSYEEAQIEKKFRCPYCHERISMLLDVSEAGRHNYVEDCEVCCQPIQLTYSSHAGKLDEFEATRS